MHNQVLVYRGNEVESKHNFSYVISDPHGHFLHTETIDPMIFPRSAIKLFQVLPFLTTGAYTDTKSNEQQISVACGSHNAETIHIECVRQWLLDNDLNPHHLACGPSLPRLQEDIKHIYENKIPLSSIHNNCSGKHTAMLLTAKHMQWDMNTYHLAAHPLQQLITTTIETICNHKLDTKRMGIDGCALPNYMLSLQDLAIGAARYAMFANKNSNPLEKACHTVLNAITKYPYMIAGKERLCSELAIITQGRLIAKIGAEGVYMVIVRDKSLGLSLKVEDGAFRASEVALVHILKRHSLLNDQEVQRLQKWFEVPLFNTRNQDVGKITAIV